MTKSPENNEDKTDVKQLRVVCANYQHEFYQMAIDHIGGFGDPNDSRDPHEYINENTLDVQYDFCNELKYYYLVNTLKNLPTRKMSDEGVSINPRDADKNFKELSPLVKDIASLVALTDYCKEFKLKADINEDKVEEIANMFPPIGDNSTLILNPFIRHLHLILKLGTSRSSVGSLRKTYRKNGFITADSEEGELIIQMFNDKECFAMFKEHASTLDKIFKYYSYTMTAKIIAESYYKKSDSIVDFYPIQSVAQNSSTEDLPVKATSLMEIYRDFLPESYNPDSVKKVLNKHVKTVKRIEIDYKKPRFIENGFSWSYNMFDIGQVPDDIKSIDDMTPKQKEWYELFSAYVDLLINNNYDDKKVLLTAIRHTFNTPNKKLQNRIWITGGQGLGKTAFCRFIGMAWGNTDFAWGEDDAVKNKNKWSIADANHLYRYFDEIDPDDHNFAGKKLTEIEKQAQISQFIKQTKSEITGNDIIANSKGGKIGKKQGSKLHICCSNSVQYLRLVDNERRRELLISFGANDTDEIDIFKEKFKEYKHLFTDFTYDDNKSVNENLSRISTYICKIFQHSNYYKGNTESPNIDSDTHDRMAEVIRYFFNNNGDINYEDQIDGRYVNLKCYSEMDYDIDEEMMDIDDLLNSPSMYYKKGVGCVPTYNCDSFIYGKSFRDTFRRLYEGRVSFTSNQVIEHLKTKYSLVSNRVKDDEMAENVFNEALDVSDLDNDDKIVPGLREHLSKNKAFFTKTNKGNSKQDDRKQALITYFNKVAHEADFIDDKESEFSKYFHEDYNGNGDLKPFLTQTGYYSQTDENQ